MELSYGSYKHDLQVNQMEETLHYFSLSSSFHLQRKSMISQHPHIYMLRYLSCANNPRISSEHDWGEPIWPLHEHRTSSLAWTMNKICEWAPKLTRQMVMDTYWVSVLPKQTYPSGDTWDPQIWLQAHGGICVAADLPTRGSEGCPRSATAGARVEGGSFSSSSPAGSGGQISPPKWSAALTATLHAESQFVAWTHTVPWNLERLPYCILSLKFACACDPLLKSVCDHRQNYRSGEDMAVNLHTGHIRWLVSAWRRPYFSGVWSWI